LLFFNNSRNLTEQVPTGSGELTPDKPIKMNVKWSNTSGLHDRGTFDEAGISNPSGGERMLETMGS